jgi:hypothetical protein
MINVREGTIEKNTKDTNEEEFGNFQKEYANIMKNMNFSINRNVEERSIRSISEHVPDKWDIAAGLILTGAISATVFSISAISYYIILGMYGANLLPSIGTLVSAAMKTKIVNDQRDKMMALFKKELSWVLKGNLFIVGNVASENLKTMHLKIKKFLVEHFESEENFDKYWGSCASPTPSAV